MPLPKINTPAPPFKGLDEDGGVVDLKDFLGKKVVLYFYPKDDTPGCTAQACSLRDNFVLLKKKGIVVLGVSVDSAKSHIKFKSKYELPFKLVTDEGKEICNLYGVYGEKMMMGRKYLGVIRTTFLINEKGVIDYIIEKPDTQNHAQEILNFWSKIKK